MELIENTSEQKYKRAKVKMETIKCFYQHLAIYVIFVFVFIWLNLNGGSDFPWAIFPIAGWGLGILGHASETFEYSIFFGKDWERRKIRKLMDEDDERMKF
jgi:hypothetical protein